MQEEEWHVEVRFLENLGSAELRELELAGGTPGGARRRGHDVSYYTPDEASARRFIAAAGARGGALVRLERWSTASAEWQPITVGVTTEETRGANVSFPDSAWLRRPRVIAAFVAFVIVAGLLFYFVPGSSGSPNAGRHHDLGRTISLTLVSLIVAIGICWSRFGRRSR